VVQQPGFVLRQYHSPAGPVGKPLEHDRAALLTLVRLRPWSIRYIAFVRTRRSDGRVAGASRAILVLAEGYPGGCARH
jgi:hypothetical protein